MKLLATFVLAAGLVTLGGCGRGDNAANNVTADTFNVAPDDLGTDNLLGNEALVNDTTLDTTNAALDNSATNAAANSQ